MEKNNQCQCYPAEWCPDENQMEPGYTCSYCQRQEHEHMESLNREQPTVLMVSEDDDLPF